VLPDAAALQQSLVLAAIALLSMAALARRGADLSREGLDTRAVNLATEAVAGTLFALGLSASGMVRPTKVRGWASQGHRWLCGLQSTDGWEAAPRNH